MLQKRCAHGALTFLVLILTASLSVATAAEPKEKFKVWPDKPPGEARELPPEADKTKPNEGLVAGKRVIRLGNVSTPELHLFPAPSDKANGTGVLICPGGGHQILAWDLEGTEVAEWLNSQGVTAVVLKYRVPAQDPAKTWVEALEDAQRAMSLVRSRAGELKIDPKRLGILGFSAGGETAALTALTSERAYKPIDDVDKVSQRPDFAVLVYPAYLVEKDDMHLRSQLEITRGAPPFFLTQAMDDPVKAENCLLLALALKQAGASAEVHVYASGGHGFGLRHSDNPCSTWPDRCADWMKHQGLLKKKPKE